MTTAKLVILCMLAANILIYWLYPISMMFFLSKYYRVEVANKKDGAILTVFVLLWGLTCILLGFSAMNIIIFILLAYKLYPVLRSRKGKTLLIVAALVISAVVNILLPSALLGSVEKMGVLLFKTCCKADNSELDTKVTSTASETVFTGGRSINMPQIDGYSVRLDPNDLRQHDTPSQINLHIIMSEQGDSLHQQLHASLPAMLVKGWYCQYRFPLYSNDDFLVVRFYSGFADKTMNWLFVREYKVGANTQVQYCTWTENAVILADEVLVADNRKPVFGTWFLKYLELNAGNTRGTIQKEHDKQQVLE